MTLVLWKLNIKMYYGWNNVGKGDDLLGHAYKIVHIASFIVHSLFFFFFRWNHTHFVDYFIQNKLVGDVSWLKMIPTVTSSSSHSCITRFMESNLWDMNVSK